jgi:transketolase
VIVLTRQNLPVLEPSPRIAEGVDRGAYVLSEAHGSQMDVILIGTGSEVHIALEAQKLLTERGIGARVVSMPSWERFERQTQDYQDGVLPPVVRARVSIEAGVTTGWQKWVGDGGASIGIDRFGASAPYQEIYRQFGLTPEHVAQAALALLGRV